MLIFLFFITISNFVLAMELTKSASICYLAQLPIPIQQQIVDYLSLDLPTYETEDVFKKRLEKMDYCPIATVNTPVALKDKKVSINKNGSLILSQKKKFLTEKELLISSNTDVNVVRTLRNIFKSTVKHSFTPQNQVMGFVLSPNKRYIASLIHFDKIQLHSAITKEMLSEISLQEYYDNEGSLQSQSEEQVDEFLARRYYSNLEFECYGRSVANYVPKNKNELHKWQNPVRTFTVSNNAQLIAFPNDHQIFLITRKDENSYCCKKIYESSLKHLPPDLFDIAGIKNGNIKGLIFNRQNTKLGILYNEFYQLVPDKGSDLASSLTDRDTYMKYVIIQILQFQNLTQEEQTAIEAIKELPGKTFMIKAFPIIEKKDNNDAIYKKEVLTLVEDKLTLADWFRRMAVCKKWQEQCSGWRNVI